MTELWTDKILGLMVFVVVCLARRLLLPLWQILTRFTGSPMSLAEWNGILCVYYIRHCSLHIILWHHYIFRGELRSLLDGPLLSFRFFLFGSTTTFSAIGRQVVNG